MANKVKLQILASKKPTSWKIKKLEMVAEWLKSLVSKTNMGVIPSRVRIPPSPPRFTFSEIERYFFPVSFNDLMK